MILYHGGSLDLDTPILPFIHLGTKAAALDRIRANLTDPMQLRPDANKLLTCRVDLTGTVLETADWGTANPAGICLVLFKLGLLGNSNQTPVERVRAKRVRN